MRDTKRLLIIGHDYRTREIVNGVQAYCRLHGKWEYHWEADSGPDRDRRLRMAIHQWKADGIIAHVRNVALFRLFQRAGRPLINLSGWRDLDLPTVISDDVAVGQMAARHFLDSGFRNFAFCARTPELYVQKRCDSFARELARTGHNCDVFTDEFTGQVKTDWVRNSRRMDRWLLSLKKPTGLLCIYDLRAQEVSMACQRLGLRVPDEVAIVGVDNEETLCRMCTPELSSIAIDHHKTGYEAIRLLHRIMCGGQAPSKPVLIPPRRVIIRGSSDIVAIADPDVSAAVRYIRDHGHEPLRVKEILQHVPISRKTLEIKFLKLLGRSPGEEIKRVRLERVKSLLAETDLPMPGVAQKTGFTRADTFSFFFRRKMGMTPTQYRRISKMGEINGSSARNYAQ